MVFLLVWSESGPGGGAGKPVMAHWMESAWPLYQPHQLLSSKVQSVPDGVEILSNLNLIGNISQIYIYINNY